MNKINLEKNRLDLSYKRNLQLLNIVLISGIGAIFAYIGALILNPEKIFYYTVIVILVSVISYVFYKRINDNLKNVSIKIKNLIKF